MKLVQCGETPTAAAASPAGGTLVPGRLSVLMPVYNEFWTLRTIVARVLSSPVPVEIELLIVDDCSTDGSWDVIQKLAAADPRIRPLRHERNAGKGAALRTAIAQASGEIAIVQDADLEYDPHEFPALLQPILDGRADAVFGSRYAGTTRRVSPFWHTMINKSLTFLSNVVNNLCLTDMETCYKMVRTDILQRLRLKSKSFTFEPELTCRLAQWGARIWEVPISYNARSYLDGKKIRPRDGILALWEIFRSRYLDRRFTEEAHIYSLAGAAQARRYQSRLARQIEPYLGQRVLEMGAGLGALSGHLVRRERLILADDDPLCVNFLRQRFGGRDNVAIECASLAQTDQYKRVAEAIDTVVCLRGLENIDSDQQALAGFFDLLPPGGHCILVIPGDSRRLTSFDPSNGRQRRYDRRQINEMLSTAGFEAIYCKSHATLAGRFLDRLLPGEGPTLVVIGRKPAASAQRAAA